MALVAVPLLVFFATMGLQAGADAINRRRAGRCGAGPGKGSTLDRLAQVF